MTANELITNLSKTTLVGIKVSDLTEQDNIDTLLSLLNMAKNKLAEDTLLWLGGETVEQVTDTYEYTLSEIPLQIIDVYDANEILRERNQPTSTGYYQTSPQTVKFNSISNGLDIYLNYYKTPPDYIITDALVIPPSLLSALQFYIAHKAFEKYKGEEDIFYSAEYYKKYQSAVTDYNNRTDSMSSDSILSTNNKMWKRNIR